MNVVYAAWYAAREVTQDRWWQNRARVREVVYEAIDDFVFDYLESIEATTSPPIDDVSKLED